MDDDARMDKVVYVWGGTANEVNFSTPDGHGSCNTEELVSMYTRYREMGYRVIIDMNPSGELESLDEKAFDSLMRGLMDLG